MKHVDRIKRAILILLGIIVILIVLVLEDSGMAEVRSQSSLLKYPISNVEFRISK